MQGYELTFVDKKKKKRKCWYQAMAGQEAKETFLAWTRYLLMCCYESLQKKQKENDLYYS